MDRNRLMLAVVVSKVPGTKLRSLILGSLPSKHLYLWSGRESSKCSLFHFLSPLPALSNIVRFVRFHLSLIIALHNFDATH